MNLIFIVIEIINCGECVYDIYLCLLKDCIIMLGF